ncbi:MAG TPA: cupin domain-containing protein [Steroidobacteraceae bacterium]|nr:cupin domain-containing protein [Steroidobacteraceae bacterium]
MKKIDLAAIKIALGSGYPAPYDEPCRQRQRLRLGDVAGLTQFGINLLRLPPGTWSSQRHWHTAEDEFVYILEGEVVLVSDAGEEVLRAGDCAGFKAGEANGHHLQNRTNMEVVLLEVGSRNPANDGVDYPDLDLTIRAGTRSFLHKDGTPYPPRPR